MSSYNESGKLSFVANSAIPKYSRVVQTALGRVGIASATQKDIGTCENEVLAAEEDAMVRARNIAGTQKVIANGAIAVGATLYTAANGRVDDAAAAGSFEWGVAITAATAAGDIIEALRAVNTGAASA